MRYMVIERLRDPRAIYERLRKRGRGLPAGLRHLDSWVSADLERCFQLMECEDASLLDAWMAVWSDLAAFEVVPVIASAEASARALGS